MSKEKKFLIISGLPLLAQCVKKKVLKGTKCKILVGLRY